MSIGLEMIRKNQQMLLEGWVSGDLEEMDFIDFCEAQLVWDTAMAINHPDAHPDRVMVLMAGSAHARKMGIPYQVKGRSQIRFVSLLPHTPGIFDPDTLTAADADFVIMP